MKSFEKVMQKVHDRQNKPVHTVVAYNYTMEETREFVLKLTSREKTVSFEKVFEKCRDRIQAIFFFLSMLELIQLDYMSIIIGEGKNNFIVEWNDNRIETETSGTPVNFDPTLN
jgi:segregation and condensation protein A